ncbi:MAG: hypothetical protein WHS86_09905 [Desulfosoma sp.]
MKFVDREDPFLERFDAALSRGKGKIVELPKPCAACGRYMRTTVPFLSVSTYECRAVGDALEILDGEDWLALCEECAARYDLSTVRPVQRPGAVWAEEADAAEETEENVVELFDGEEGDVLYYYFECARCGELITEREIFTRFQLSRVVHVHRYLKKELEEVASLEFCRECAEMHDFTKVVLWRRDKGIAELFTFDRIFKDAWQKVSVREWLL